MESLIDSRIDSLIMDYPTIDYLIPDCYAPEIF